MSSLVSNINNSSYEDTIAALNRLQTNAQSISQEIKKEMGSNSSRSLEKVLQFLSLLGIKLEELNKLNVIHVAGTKGKGSTCAFSESILRQYGYKTGFASSPHLVTARERIRINSVPISKSMFVKYFWLVYNKIEKSKPPELGMPPYFMFLTLLEFKIFLDEAVDVAVFEVGVGGEYDCTNIVPKPIVTGISSISLDHCSILGDTIDQIAWHKAGTFKSGVPAFTVKQDELAMKVLIDRAQEKNCSLFICPELSLYPHTLPFELGIKGGGQQLNASLALQLTNFWLQRKQNSSYQPSSLIMNKGVYAVVFPLNDKQLLSLSQCRWPGRCQTFKKGNVTYFLDGAHNADSMEHCSNWFISESQKLKTTEKTIRVLIFNCTHKREPDDFMPKLNAKFDIAIFCPNRVNHVKDIHLEQSNFTITTEEELENCDINSISWKKYDPNATIVKFSCISEAISLIVQKSKSEPIHVLVTGSVHLVGGVLGIIDPDLSSIM